MIQSYAATLLNGQIQWGSGGPPAVPPNVGVPVQVTIGFGRRASDGPAMAAALEQIASHGGAAEFGDPVAWQAATRTDRPLPGREE
ncbi:MAG: hypothetical protein KF873_10280 [Gemmataceae bacterium]|nr:hypothetical protein [Planctomycetia bacterium]MBX3399120.1 hypothetical protein [Gemmataceae bacterium]